MPLVKICGITRPADALEAVRLGASAIGFIFWPGSPRVVDPERAAAIVAALPPFVTPVGVFVNQAVSDINEIARVVGLGAVQLHGDEDPEVASAIGRPIVKAISASGDRQRAARWPARVMLLVDAHDPARRGGTGRTADWDLAAALARERPIVLAGGLTPENVAEAIARVRPFGIDVSSGVESAPGVKDAQRLGALFASVRAAQSGVETLT